MDMKLIFENELSKVFKTSNKNEYYILRQKEALHNYDEVEDEFWVEVFENMGFYYLNIDSDRLSKSNVFPLTVLQNRWLTFSELCALPVEIEAECCQCHSSIDLKYLKLNSEVNDWEKNKYSHINCEDGDDCQIR